MSIRQAAPQFALVGRLVAFRFPSPVGLRGSVLSLQGDNLRLEKGTRLNLLESNYASAGATTDQ